MQFVYVVAASDCFVRTEKTSTGLSALLKTKGARAPTSFVNFSFSCFSQKKRKVEKILFCHLWDHSGGNHYHYVQMPQTFQLCTCRTFFVCSHSLFGRFRVFCFVINHGKLMTQQLITSREESKVTPSSDLWRNWINGKKGGKLLIENFPFFAVSTLT